MHKIENPEVINCTSLYALSHVYQNVDATVLLIPAIWFGLCCWFGPCASRIRSCGFFRQCSFYGPSHFYASKALNKVFFTVWCGHPVLWSLPLWLAPNKGLVCSVVRKSRQIFTNGCMSPHRKPEGLRLGQVSTSYWASPKKSIWNSTATICVYIWTCSRLFEFGNL